MEIVLDGESEQLEVNELLDHLKGASRERTQKAKIFYKNLKLNYKLIIDHEDWKKQSGSVGKERIERIEDRVIETVVQNMDSAVSPV